MSAPSPLPSPHGVATKSSAASPWEHLERALGRLESAILTQKHLDEAESNTQETERLQRQNAHMRATLRQTLAELKTILDA